VKLNTIHSADGARKKAKRVGRGIGSGFGKTCGRGHKGQKSRTGGTIMSGFEGGQMPIHRRLPKLGFTSRKSLVSCDIRLSDLSKLKVQDVTIESLKQAGLVANTTKFVKIFASGSVNEAYNLKGISVTKGAKNQIETAGGKVEV
jgi:large subunit ribosomal protein L15